MEAASWCLLLLLLPLPLLAPCVSASGDDPDHPSCPDRDDFSLPEGSAKVVAANVSAYPKTLALYKDLEVILFINQGRINTVKNAFSDCFYMSGNDLAIKNANKVLTGYYHLTSYLNEFPVKQFCLAILDPWNCSSDSFSLAEGSSEKIIPNLSSNSSDLVLYKKVNVSSDWEHILNITDGHLSYTREEYKNHFLLSEDGLILKDATEGLTGEYQLVGKGNKTCVRKSFLNVTGSAEICDSTCLKIISISIPVIVVVVLLALCVGLFIYCKNKRRKENKENKYYYHYTKGQDSENGFLQNGNEGTEIDRQA